MAGRFTKEIRQKIVRDFATKHNGVYNPRLFLEEVRRQGSAHPAFEWFEWDREAAAMEWQIEQARDFARGLVISFTVEEIGPKKAVRIVERAMPMVLSPIDKRRDGGGYVLTDPENADHQAEHCRQAAQALAAWLTRYASALTFAGSSVKAIEDQVKLLDAAVPKDAEAA